LEKLRKRRETATQMKRWVIILYIQKPGECVINKWAAMVSRQLYPVTSFTMLTNYIEQEEISTGTSDFAKSTSKCSEKINIKSIFHGFKEFIVLEV
jgi:hypothetical protein